MPGKVLLKISLNLAKMVITDLEEVDPATRQVIDDLSKAGFIIIGVTVASDKAAKAFPYACAIQEASELNTALFGAVSKIFSSTLNPEQRVEHTL